MKPDSIPGFKDRKRGRFWWLSRCDSIIFWCSAAMILGLLVFVLPNLNEPRFDGRTARQWLAAADIARSGTDPAVLKIKSFGPAIYSELWRLSSDDDSKLERKFRNFWDRLTQNAEPSLQVKARTILVQERSKLKSLTPQFVKTLEENGAHASIALQLLCASNDDPSVYTPHLVASLENNRLNIFGLSLLKRHHTNANLALPGLRNLQTSSNTVSRVFASSAVILLGAGTTNESRLITRALSDADPDTRRGSAVAISLALQELIRIDPSMPATFRQITQKHSELAPFFRHVVGITNAPSSLAAGSNP